MVEQASPHQNFVVSLHCPKCSRILSDVEFLAKSVTGISDSLQLFDSQQDRSTQSAYDSYTHAEITESQRLAWELAESQRLAWEQGRPAMARALVPEHHDANLGVRGPMTQTRSWREVDAPGGQRSLVFACTFLIKRKPCGATPSIRHATLVRLVRDTLARGEHHLTLP